MILWFRFFPLPQLLPDRLMVGIAIFIVITTFSTSQFQTTKLNSTLFLGIGKEYAKQLAQRGINIVLIARNEAKLIATSREIGMR